MALYTKKIVNEFIKHVQTFHIILAERHIAFSSLSTALN
jgi:hypothetical protein